MGKAGGIFGRQKMARALGRVAAIKSRAHVMTNAELTEAEHDLERLRQEMDAAGRDTQAARAALGGQGQIAQPEQCDFALRPDLWTTPVQPRGSVAISSPCALSKAVTLYHDCPAPELSFQQLRATEGAARYHLALDVYRFGGGFVSLVQSLPGAALEGLTRGHVFALTLEIDCEQPLEIYGRLNLQSGPNTEQIVREMPVTDGQALAEFDLAYTQINEKRMERVWLDLIFEGPQMNRILLRDMTITRAPRAEI